MSVVSAHYDSRFAWLLLIQQSRPALKLLTVSALTTSLGKLFHKLAERLKKKFSRWTCFVISFWYLKRCPLVWFCWTAIVLLVSNLSLPLKILYSCKNKITNYLKYINFSILKMFLSTLISTRCYFKTYTNLQKN